MSSYPPPTSMPPIFNPLLFSQAISGISSGSLGTTALQYPIAQGAETWQGTNSAVVIGSDGVALSSIIEGLEQGVGLNGEGFAWNNGSTISTITWDNLSIKVQAIGAITSATDATTLNINNTVQIQNGESATLPHTFVSLSADTDLLRMNLCQDGTTDEYGTAGDVLHSGGVAGSMYWGAGGGSQNLQQVLDTGNTATTAMIINNDVSSDFLIPYTRASQVSQLNVTVQNVTPTIDNGASQISVLDFDRTKSEYLQFDESGIPMVNKIVEMTLGEDNSNTIIRSYTEDLLNPLGYYKTESFLKGDSLSLSSIITTKGNKNVILDVEGITKIFVPELEGQTSAFDIDVPALSLAGEYGNVGDVLTSQGTNPPLWLPVGPVVGPYVISGNFTVTNTTVLSGTVTFDTPIPNNYIINLVMSQSDNSTDIIMSKTFLQPTEVSYTEFAWYLSGTRTTPVSFNWIAQVIIPIP